MRGEGESVSEAAAGTDKQYCRSSSEQRRTCRFVRYKIEIQNPARILRLNSGQRARGYVTVTL